MIVYHHVNAFEDDGHVIFDVIAYKDNSLYDMFYFSKLKEKAGSHDESYSKPSYKRFALPVQPDKVGFQKTDSNLKFRDDVSLTLIYLSNFLAGFCRAWRSERTW